MTVRKVNDRWSAAVRIKGHKPQYKTFDTKSQALIWVEQTKEAIKRGGATTGNNAFKVKDIFERYMSTESKRKKGAHWEQLRLKSMMKSNLAGVKLSSLNASHVAQWRNERMLEVSNSTVNREFALIGHAFEIATNEWCWMASNPTKKVRRLPNPLPRDRRISDSEIETLCHAMEYSEDCDFKKKSQRVASAFLFAIETAMRLGELCSLEWGDIRGRVARLKETKNGHPRNVPLSKRALEILENLPKNRDKIFNLRSEQASAIFRRCRQKTDIKNIVFHDTRHEATTRLSEKLPVLTLAKVTGHKDINMLMIYYNEKPDQIALKLDQ